MLCDIFDYFHTCQGRKQMTGERDRLVSSTQMNYAVQTMGTLKKNNHKLLQWTHLWLLKNKKK